MELVGLTPSELWTKDVPSSWFCVDFGPNSRVKPTTYSLRHGGNYKGDSLRTWDFQGSIDGENWVVLKRFVYLHFSVLFICVVFITYVGRGDFTFINTIYRRHTNDNSLNGAFSVQSWKLENVKESYRYFRILQTGHNSSNHNYLVASGFEIYGTLTQI